MKFRIETAVRANKEIPQEKNVSFLANMFSMVLLLSVLFVGGIVHKYIFASIRHCIVTNQPITTISIYLGRSISKYRRSLLWNKLMKKGSLVLSIKLKSHSLLGR